MSAEKKTRKVVNVLNFNDYLALAGGNRTEAIELLFAEGGVNNFLTCANDKEGQRFIFKT